MKTNLDIMIENLSLKAKVAELRKQLEEERNAKFEVEFELGGMPVRMDYKHFVQFVKDMQQLGGK
jgi:hypothetical protein